MKGKIRFSNSLTKVLAGLIIASVTLGGFSLVGNNPAGGIVAQAATVKNTKRYIKPKTAKVYKKASTSSKVVATLKRDKKVKITTEENSKGWVKIQWSSKKGYIKLSKLAKSPRIVRFAKNEYNSEIKPVAEQYDWEIFYEDFSDLSWDSEFKCYFLKTTYWFRNSDYEILVFGSGSDDPDYGINMFYNVRVKNDSSNNLYINQSTAEISKYLKKYR